MSQPIDTLMEQGVERGVFPAADLLIAHHGKILHHAHYGEARTGTIFDIASLTKPICTATLAMLAVQEKKLKLDPKLIQLLAHTSGLPAWKPYYQEVPKEEIGTPAGKKHIISACAREPIIFAPGTQCEYSDLGYILLGDILEKTFGATLDKLFAEKIAVPCKLKDTFFVKIETRVTGLSRRFAPTEDCPWRKKVLHGEVHDQNCYAMGGIAGHAGLFSTAEELHQFVVEFLKCYRGESDWISQKVVQSFIDYKKSRLETYVFGWDTPTPGSSSAGRHFSPHSIGHLGYTGCSIWIDLDRDFWVILLTNRIHPTTANEKIKAFRPRIHDLAVQTFMKI